MLMMLLIVPIILKLKTDKELKIRAGFHRGEVIIDNEDVFGDVVNIAIRLESIGKPKSFVVSNETIDQLRDKEDFNFVLFIKSIF